ncbi:FliM/FliN family flagellar motor C-terminal domain-containing protein [Oligoflexia bacterium]|nr:FliM/FliN family flagellar motor C-terminal domain-containing protein [Oligoflexia bacterium]
MIGLVAKLPLAPNAPKQAQLDYLQAETFLSWAMSKALLRPVQAVYVAPAVPFTVNRSWVTFVSGSGQEYAFSFRPATRQASVTDYCETLFRITAAHRRLGEGSECKTVLATESFLFATPLFESRFLLFATEPSRPCLGDVWYAETATNEMLSNEAVTSTGLGRRFEVNIGLYMRMPPEVAAGGAMSSSTIQLSEANFFLILNHTKGQSGKSLHARLCIQEGNMLATITKERNMNNVKNGAQPELEMQLCLGTLQISLEDAVKLRPGMTVEFERPEKLAGVLKVGSKDWFNVEVDVKDDELQLQVSSLADPVP